MNFHRKMVFSVGPVLRGRKDSLTTNSIAGPKTPGDEAHGNGNDCSGGFDLSVDARKLCGQDRLNDALHTLPDMAQQGIRLNPSAYASLLQGCISKKALPEGKLVHAHMIGTGFSPDIFLGNRLMTMYAKCGSLVDARRILDEMPKRNVASWTAMIAAYSRNGQNEEALALYNQMQRTGIRPNQYTFASVLPACANMAALEHGKKVHKDVIDGGFQSDIFVGSGLVDMYAKCAKVKVARDVFDKMPERDVVSWSAMLAGYAQNGHVVEALKFFQMMPERNVVSWSALIAGCAQNAHIDEALKLFQKMPERDAVSWNTIITGYAQNAHFNEALKLFREMQMTGVKPVPVTFGSVLSACANLAAFKNGKEVHENIMRSGFQSDIFLGSALVDMYAKCGYIQDACRVFEKMPERDVVSWTAMIVGYAMHGCGKEALQLFQRMQLSGTKPNRVTFIGVLSACCHAGLVGDGWQYFDTMGRDYNITPTVEHYCCMVDLLGRAGHLNEAQDFVNRMPIKPNAALWGSLLGACRVHANIELGERVAECLFELEPKNAARYVLLSNIYAASGRWDGVEKVRKMMKDRMVKKNPGWSWIEVNNRVHLFLVGDISHPQMHDIYTELERLSGQMKEAGYVPDMNLVLYDVE